MSSLSVRYPTGHLNNIPVVPTEPLIKVLEAACAKRSLDPKLHKLIHKRKTVDLSIPFRFSGLANRATLELVPCDQATVTNYNVRIGVRLQDGYRTEWSGMSDSTIWGVLESLAAQDQRIADMLTISSDNLVPTYGGEDNLRDTTINSLGIRDSALFQLMKRQAPPPTIKKESESFYSVSSTFDVPKPTEPKAEIEQSAPPSMKKSSRNSSSGASIETSVEETPLPRPQNQTTFQQQRQEQNLSQGESLLNFEPFSNFSNPRTRSIFDSDDTPRERNTHYRPISLGEMLGISLEPNSRTHSSEATVPPQLREFRFPSETEGRNLMDPEDGTQEGQTADSRPCDREEKIYEKETDTTAATSSQDDTDELPDQYFELSRSELQKIIADLRKVAGTDALLGEHTAQQRAAQKKFLRLIPRCIVRFIWSDNVVLQACFNPMEPVSALYDFIRERLADKNLSFYLFTAPPRVVLSNMTETLYQLKLHHAANVYFSAKSGSSKGREVLKNDLLKRITRESETEAREVASKWAPNPTRLKTMK